MFRQHPRCGRSVRLARWDLEEKGELTGQGGVLSNQPGPVAVFLPQCLFAVTLSPGTGARSLVVPQGVHTRMYTQILCGLPGSMYRSLTTVSTTNTRVPSRFSVTLIKHVTPILPTLYPHPHFERLHLRPNSSACRRFLRPLTLQKMRDPSQNATLCCGFLNSTSGGHDLERNLFFSCSPFHDQQNKRQKSEERDTAGG